MHLTPSYHTIRACLPPPTSPPGLHDRLTVKGTKSQKRLVALEEKKAKQAEEREKQRRKREEMLAVQRENLERARVLKEVSEAT